MKSEMMNDIRKKIKGIIIDVFKDKCPVCKNRNHVVCDSCSCCWNICNLDLEKIIDETMKTHYNIKLKVETDSVILIDYKKFREIFMNEDDLHVDIIKLVIGINVTTRSYGMHNLIITRETHKQFIEEICERFYMQYVNNFIENRIKLFKVENGIK